MKKILSIVLAMVMVVTLGFSSMVVMAADDTTFYGSQETTKKRVKPSVTVNGNQTNDITVDYDDSDDNVIIFTYIGDGDLSGWNFYDGDGNLLVEGVDYEVEYDGNTATVTILNDNIDEIVADAIVSEKEDDKTTTSEQTTESTTNEGTTKPNKGSESPDTGAVSGAGLAIAGAGVAILAVLKKKNDAE